ncbi:hypothetical protein DF146_15450 [Burkholderia cenocepacia]|uniref:hypothetical protein n=1 Tax=Burkholderia cenocepacia TaxID=95486 RepID=UPI000F59A6F2|nr:hypothetical protein [Burkholderia cenocepacia]MDV3100145.1 hypothetical protein [Burkholderia cenocepacia]RQT97064.1 hypothetical protein DF165_11630 [Burkholderia cenocepacia]RQU53388.1 hypothetical protein DF146_15450 [Burkholderia cenocepacia]HDR9882092.1 hypothetical protein [Burkholderia cenocepacia]HDR9889444.1 hypothetical protein [Burkholderia cenocepacia]
MTSTYEICGALSVVGHFRRNHAQQFAQSLPASATVYCVTDAVTHSVMIRLRGALTDQEVTSVEGKLKEFSQKWARTAAVFSRIRFGERSLMSLAPGRHVERLKGPATEYVRHHTSTPPHSDAQNTQVLAAPLG